VADLHDLYRGEARYVDERLKGFIDTLKSRGIWESTAIVFTSDHGELFGDREVPGDAPMKHPTYLCEEISHVPLVIAGGAVDSEMLTHPTSGMDIAPTITKWLNAQSDDDWRGVEIGSEAHFERSEVVTAVSHTRGSGVSIDPEELHIAARDDTRELLWWRSDHPNEYYLRDSDGVRKCDRSDEWIHLETTAESTANLLDEVRDIGDVGGEVSGRLADLGYVER
jgi:arylsulfatase A-like enzyme